MKKLFTLIATAALVLGSCTSEKPEWAEETVAKDARISLNITNDQVMNTRAVSNVADASNWYITVGENSQIQVSSLSSKTYEAGSYTIKVGNYTNEAAALDANDAYYEGSATETLSKGNNAVTVACGKAKNCRVKADLSNLTDFTAITEVKLTASQGSTSRVLSNGDLGYFSAGTTISYQLDYKYNGTSKTAITNSITTPAAATEYQVKVVTNSNGTISLTITYDTEFTTTEVETITIDAATGAKVDA